MVQCFGCVGRDQSIQATAILLVEKCYFNKLQIELWMTKLKDLPSKTPKQSGSTACHPESPHKWWVLGDRGNTLIIDVDPYEEALDAAISPEEEWLWAQMSAGDSVTPSMTMEGTTTVTRFDGNQSNPGEAGDKVQDVDDGEEEQESRLPVMTVSKSNEVKVSSIQKKMWKHKSPTAEFDDQHLAAFMYCHLLPQTNSQPYCRRKVLDCLYENDRLGV